MSGLVEAANRGDVAGIKSALEHDYDLGQKNWALCCAARSGNIEAVEVLLESGAELRAKEDLATACAIGGGHAQMVRYLISKGSILNEASVFHHYSSKSIRISIVKLYFDFAFNLTQERLNILAVQALQLGQCDAYLYLLMKGASLSKDEIVDGLSALLDPVVAFMQSDNGRLSLNEKVNVANIAIELGHFSEEEVLDCKWTILGQRQHDTPHYHSHYEEREDFIDGWIKSRSGQFVDWDKKEAWIIKQLS